MAADVRLQISVDATGAVTSVKQLNEAIEQTPKAADKAGDALKKAEGELKKTEEAAKKTKNEIQRLGEAFGGGIGAAVGKLGDGIARISTPIGAVGSAIDAAVVALTTFGAAIVGTGVFVAFQAGKLAKYSDEVVTLANKFRVTTEAVQLFRVAATVGGTTIEGIATAMQKMQVAIGKGDDVFARLGLSLTNLKSMAPDEALATVAKRIGEIKAPADQAAAAVEAFGKQGLAVLPALAEGFSELKRTSQEYGLILKGEVIQAAEAFGDRFDLVNQAWDAFLMRIGAVIANSPAVMAVLDQLGKMFGAMSGWVEANSSALEGWVKSGLSLAIDGVIGLAEALKLATVGIIGFLKFSSIMFNVTGGGVFSKLMGFEGGKALANFDATAAMNSMLSPIEAFQKAMIEMANAVDASGKKVASSPLFNGSLSFMGAPAAGKGGGKKGFDLSQATFLRDLQEFARINSSYAGPTLGFPTQLSGASLLDMPGRRDPFSGVAGAGQGLMADPQFVSNLFAAYNEPVKKAGISLSQALQNLANVAQLSGSKLAKGIASIAGGAVGALSGLDMFKTAGGGLPGLLGKIGGIGSIASSVLSLGSSLFGLFKSKPKAPAPEPPKQATAEAWATFTGDQMGKGAAGVLAGVSGIKVTTPEDMASQGIIASSLFWQMFKEKGVQAAADAFRPIRDKMMETFRAAGADDGAINAMLGPMSQQIDLAANDAFKGASEGSKGFADALAAMANSQLPMTIDQFRAFELQAVNGFNQMKSAALEQGLTMEQAIEAAALSSGTYLQTIKDAAAKYGFSLGGGTQGLFDEATAAGVAFGGSSQERLIMSIDRLTETLGGAPPKFEQAISAGAQSGTRGPGADALAPGVDFRAGFADVSAAIRDLANRPVEVHSTINSHLSIDGTAIADAVANEFERGGTGGTRMREALDGRG